MSIKYEIKDLSEKIKIYGYSLVSDKYVNEHTKLDIKCDKGHVYKTSYTNFNKEYV